MSNPLGNHHADVKRLRALLRDRGARHEHGVFVCEGPRVIAAALDQGATFEAVFVGVDATPAARAVADRAVECFIPVRQLGRRCRREGQRDHHAPRVCSRSCRCAARIIDAAHGRVARARRPACSPIPGNAGTLIRSAAAGRRNNRPRAGIGRRVQSQDRAGIGRRVFRSPDRGGCARREGLGGARERRRTPRRRAGIGWERAGVGRSHRARPRSSSATRCTASTPTSRSTTGSRSRCTAPSR